MKDFFYIVFGGLLAIFIGFLFVKGSLWVWTSIDEYFSSHKQNTSTANIQATKKQKIYTAEEEERNIIDSYANSLQKSPDSKISAKGYMVKNLVRGDVVIAYNEETLMPIASVSKLVTAAVARRFIATSSKITISKEILATYGNTAGLRKGETFLASDLIYPLLMVSSNDAAEAFAQHYGRKNFIKAMNNFTSSIGAYRTYFADPSGLSAENVSTATDLAIILDWIRQNDPQILEITRLKTKTIRNHTWTNPNKFLNWSNYAGGKNGYTEEAKNTATSIFTIGRNKNPYAVIVLGSSSRDGDETKLLQKVVE